MSDINICSVCSAGNHENHRPDLAGICIGCACRWRPEGVPNGR